MQIHRACFRLSRPWGFCASFAVPLLGVVLAGLNSRAAAEELPSPFSGIRGSLVICGGGKLSEQIFEEFMELGGASQARMVVIPTASVVADSPELDSHMDVWRQRRPASFSVLHTRNRATADLPEFSQALLEATAVWFIGGDQNHLTSAYLGTLVEQRLKELLDRGGVIGGTSAGAAIMSPTMISGTRDRERSEPVLDAGFGFLPGCVVDQHFVKRNREPRLRNALLARPGHVGIGIDEGTALVVSGRSVRIVGDSCVKLYLPETGGRAELVETLNPGATSDLAAFCRTIAEPPRALELASTPDPKASEPMLVDGGATGDMAVK